MKFVYLTHSLQSCWNHGNAHFLRGIVRDLQRRVHEVRVLEPADGWSRENLLADQGEAPLQRFDAAFPDLRSETYRQFDAAEAVDGADVVIVHEWTDHRIVEALSRLRRNGGRFRLLFHDTHHRAVSDPESLPRREIEGYDAVLAFGECLSEVYRGWGWGARVFTWHEAADVTHFLPREGRESAQSLVWIGNWGDDERSRELESFLFGPVSRLGLPLDVHGVRYPQDALDRLAEIGATYRGWVANADAPEVFARHMATVHVPRRQYVERLPGIPTIRVFEALACGIPLASAYWPDAENLFTPGADYMVAHDGAEMEANLRALAGDADLRAALAAHGLETIRDRHTCRHRVDELMAVLEALDAPAERQPAEARA